MSSRIASHTRGEIRLSCENRAWTVCVSPRRARAGVEHELSSRKNLKNKELKCEEDGKRMKRKHAEEENTPKKLHGCVILSVRVDLNHFKGVVRHVFEVILTVYRYKNGYIS